MNEGTSDYQPFVSKLLLRQLSTNIAPARKDYASASEPREPVPDKKLLIPFSETVYGCVLFADISGFTNLASKLPTESLKIHINEYFSRLLRIIHIYHGDVVKFCGDAVIVVWPLDKEFGKADVSESSHATQGNATDTSDDMAAGGSPMATTRASLVLLASLCALEMIQECGEYIIPLPRTVPLKHSSSCYSTPNPSENINCGPSSFTDVPNRPPSSPSDSYSNYPGARTSFGRFVEGIKKDFEGLASPHGSGQSFSKAVKGEPLAQTACPNIDGVEPSVSSSICLSLHCGIAVGLVHCMCLGVDSRFEYLISGQVVDYVGEAASLAKRSQVCVHGDAMSLVADCLESTSLADETAGVPPHADSPSTHMPSSGFSLLTGRLAENIDHSIAENIDHSIASSSTSDGDDCVDENHLPNTTSGARSGVMYNEIVDSVVSFSSSIDCAGGISEHAAGHDPPHCDKDLLPPLTEPGHRVSGLRNQLRIDSIQQSIDVLLSSSTMPVGQQFSPHRSATQRMSQVILPGIGRLGASLVQSASQAAEGFGGRRSLVEGDPSRRASTTSPKETSLPLDGGNTLSGSRYSFTVDGSPTTPIRSSMAGGNTTPVTPSRNERIGSIISLPTSFIFGNSPALAQKSAFSREGNANGGSGSAGSNRLIQQLCGNNMQLANVNGSSMLLPKIKFVRYLLKLQESASVAYVRQYLEQPYNKASFKEYYALHGWSSETSTESGRSSCRKDNNTSMKLNASLKSRECPSDVIDKCLRYFVHESALTSVDNKSTEYLAEIREIVTIFIKLVNLEDDFAAGLLPRPQHALQIIISALHRIGGSLRQFVVDDKGCVAIASFGNIGSCAENNHSAAVKAAKLIRAALHHEVNVSCRIGITSGQVFCGLVGTSLSAYKTAVSRLSSGASVVDSDSSEVMNTMSHKIGDTGSEPDTREDNGDMDETLNSLSYFRCEYSLMGASVNLSARLMSACAVGEVLVDETVYQSSGAFSDTSRVSTAADAENAPSAMPSVDKAPLMLKCKGYDHLVSVYSLGILPSGSIMKGRRRRSSYGFVQNSTDNAAHISSCPYIGRSADVKSLLSFICGDEGDKATANMHRVGSSVLWLNGETGSGRTRLVKEALLASTRPCSSLSAFAAYRRGSGPGNCVVYVDTNAVNKCRSLNDAAEMSQAYSAVRYLILQCIVLQYISYSRVPSDEHYNSDVQSVVEKILFVAEPSLALNNYSFMMFDAILRLTREESIILMSYWLKKHANKLMYHVVSRPTTATASNASRGRRNTQKRADLRRSLDSRTSLSNALFEPSSSEVHTCVGNELTDLSSGAGCATTTGCAGLVNKASRMKRKARNSLMGPIVNSMGIPMATTDNSTLYNGRLPPLQSAVCGVATNGGKHLSCNTIPVTETHSNTIPVDFPFAVDDMIAILGPFFGDKALAPTLNTTSASAAANMTAVAIQQVPASDPLPTGSSGLPFYKRTNAKAGKGATHRMSADSDKFADLKENPSVSFKRIRSATALSLLSWCGIASRPTSGASDKESLEYSVSTSNGCTPALSQDGSSEQIKHNGTTPSAAVFYPTDIKTCTTNVGLGSNVNVLKFVEDLLYICMEEQHAHCVVDDGKLKRSAAEVVFIVDNCENCDNESLQLLGNIMTRIKGDRDVQEAHECRLLCVSSTQMVGQSHIRSMLLARLIDAQGLSTRHSMTPFSLADIQEMIKRVAGPRLTREAADVFSNPLVARMIMDSMLKSSKIILPTNLHNHCSWLLLEYTRICQIRQTKVMNDGTGDSDPLNNTVQQNQNYLQDIDFSTIPSNPSNMVLYHFDQLNNRFQTILKTASLIGNIFNTAILSHLLSKLNMKNYTRELNNALCELEALDWILEYIPDESSHHDFDPGLDCPVQSDGEPVVWYVFSEFATHETLYALMLLTHRQKGHHIIATYLENEVLMNKYTFTQTHALSDVMEGVAFSSSPACILWIQKKLLKHDRRTVFEAIALHRWLSYHQIANHFSRAGGGMADRRKQVFYISMSVVLMAQYQHELMLDCFSMEEYSNVLSEMLKMYEELVHLVTGIPCNELLNSMVQYQTFAKDAFSSDVADICVLYWIARIGSLKSELVNNMDSMFHFHFVQKHYPSAKEISRQLLFCEQQPSETQTYKVYVSPESILVEFIRVSQQLAMGFLFSPGEHNAAFIACNGSDGNPDHCECTIANLTHSKECLAHMLKQLILKSGKVRGSVVDYVLCGTMSLLALCYQLLGKRILPSCWRYYYCQQSWLIYNRVVVDDLRNGGEDLLPRRHIYHNISGQTSCVDWHRYSIPTSELVSLCHFQTGLFHLCRGLMNEHDYLFFSPSAKGKHFHNVASCEIDNKKNVNLGGGLSRKTVPYSGGIPSDEAPVPYCYWSAFEVEDQGEPLAYHKRPVPPFAAIEPTKKYIPMSDIYRRHDNGTLTSSSVIQLSWFDASNSFIRAYPTIQHNQPYGFSCSIILWHLLLGGYYSELSALLSQIKVSCCYCKKQNELRHPVDLDDPFLAQECVADDMLTVPDWLEEMDTWLLVVQHLHKRTFMDSCDTATDSHNSSDKGESVAAGTPSLVGGNCAGNSMGGCSARAYCVGIIQHEWDQAVELLAYSLSIVNPTSSFDHRLNRSCSDHYVFRMFSSCIVLLGALRMCGEKANLVKGTNITLGYYLTTKCLVYLDTHCWQRIVALISQQSNNWTSTFSCMHSDTCGDLSGVIEQQQLMQVYALAASPDQSRIILLLIMRMKYLILRQSLVSGDEGGAGWQTPASLNNDNGNDWCELLHMDRIHSSTAWFKQADGCLELSGPILNMMGESDWPDVELSTHSRVFSNNDTLPLTAIMLKEARCSLCQCLSVAVP